MKITNAQIYLEHEGTTWLASFSKRERGSYAARFLDDDKKRLVIINATNEEVIEYLQEQGIPTENLVKYMLGEHDTQVTEGNRSVEELEKKVEQLESELALTKELLAANSEDTLTPDTKVRLPDGMDEYLQDNDDFGQFASFFVGFQSESQDFISLREVAEATDLPLEQVLWQAQFLYDRSCLAVERKDTNGSLS